MSTAKFSCRLWKHGLMLRKKWEWKCPKC